MPLALRCPRWPCSPQCRLRIEKTRLSGSNFQRPDRTIQAIRQPLLRTQKESSVCTNTAFSSRAQAHTFPDERLAVRSKGSKVLFRFLAAGGTQPLVVLDGPALGAALLLLPCLVLWHCVERLGLVALLRLHAPHSVMHAQRSTKTQCTAQPAAPTTPQAQHAQTPASMLHS